MTIQLTSTECKKLPTDYPSLPFGAGGSAALWMMGELEMLYREHMRARWYVQAQLRLQSVRYGDSTCMGFKGQSVVRGEDGGKAHGPSRALPRHCPLSHSARCVRCSLDRGVRHASALEREQNSARPRNVTRPPCAPFVAQFLQLLSAMPRASMLGDVDS